MKLHELSRCILEEVVVTSAAVDEDEEQCKQPSKVMNFALANTKGRAD